MNSEEYEAWLQRIDARFRKRSRKILLFVDNCPAHPKKLKCQLQAVKVVHLPPNTTSKLQPMDMGIIQKSKENMPQDVFKALNFLDDLL